MTSKFFRSWLSISFILILALAWSAVTFTPVQAAGADEDGVIEEGETIYDDVILNAESVRVDGTVEGNVLASGNTITINGRITGDAFLFASEVIIGKDAMIEGNVFSGAQTIRVAGNINGSLAAGSSAIILESGGAISGNVYYGGFSMEMDENALIGVDLFSGNYQLLLNGTVGRDVNSGAAAVEINGTINRDVHLDMGEMEGAEVYFPVPPGVSETIQPGLRVGESATIGGDLNYTFSVDQSSKILAEPEGQIIYKTPMPAEMTAPQTEQRKPDSGLRMVGRFILRTLKSFWENFISLLVVGTFVVLLLPGLFKQTVGHLRKEPLASAGFGLLTVILGYIALFLAGMAVLALSILLSFLSAGGLKTATFGFGFAALTFIGTIFTMLVIYVSKIVVSYLVGNWILTRIAPETHAAEKPFWGMALGVLIYSILRVIPIFGWLLAFIVIILGVGALWLLYRNRNTTTVVDSSVTPAETPVA